MVCLLTYVMVNVIIYLAYNVEMITNERSVIVVPFVAAIISVISYLYICFARRSRTHSMRTKLLLAPVLILVIIPIVILLNGNDWQNSVANLIGFSCLFVVPIVISNIANKQKNKKKVTKKITRPVP